MPLVSVIIPSYNHSRFIKEAIDSVLNQTHQNIELIVVDDGSTDDSLIYLSSVNDPRFFLIKQKNKGAHEAINRGLKKSKGKFIAILNSDDIYHKDRIEKCLANFGKDTGMVCSWIRLIDNEGKSLGIKKGWNNMLPWSLETRNITKRSLNEFNVNLILSNFIATTSNVIFTRKVYELVGGMKSFRFAHDWDFFLRVASSFECKIISKSLLSYRIHPANTISSNRRWMLYEICLIFAAHLKSILSKKIKDDRELLSFLMDSINTQGNNNILLALILYLQVFKSKNKSDNVESLLRNHHLRDFFMDHIKE